MLKNEIVEYFESFAKSFDFPIREGINVDAVGSAPNGGFVTRTSAGDIQSNSVVVCTGGFQKPYRPTGASTFPTDLLQIDIGEYRNQRDLIWWLVEGKFFEVPISVLPSPAAILFSNPLVTGQGGGRDLNLRTHRTMGVTLVGHFLSVDEGRVHFAKDLAPFVAWGDERYEQAMNLVRKVSVDQGLPMPAVAAPEPFDPSAPEQIDVSKFGVVIFAGGYRPDYGASSMIDNLYFAGVHFLRKRNSSNLLGVAEDAAIIAKAIVGERALIP